MLHIVHDLVIAEVGLLKALNDDIAVLGAALTHHSISNSVVGELIWEVALNCAKAIMEIRWAFTTFHLGIINCLFSLPMRVNSIMCPITVFLHVFHIIVGVTFLLGVIFSKYSNCGSNNALSTLPLSR